MENEEDFDVRWAALRQDIKKRFGKKPDLNAILFLVGVQELGQGVREFTKEEKQDLMHIATCKLLSLSGYYELDGLDQEGWPHWKSVKPLPACNLKEQERMLKWHALEYFDEMNS
jgi:hypothetical protein